MAGTLLGKDSQQKAKQDKPPSRIKRWARNSVVASTIAIAGGTAVVGGTSEAAPWDYPDRIATSVMNVCNPNSVPLDADNDSWTRSAMTALGSLERPEADGLNEEGNMWSTYNPQYSGEEGRYIGTTMDLVEDGDEGVLESIQPRDGSQPQQEDATSLWLLFIRNNDNGFVYNDPHLAGDADEGGAVDGNQDDTAVDPDNLDGDQLQNIFSGMSGANEDQYPYDPDADNAHYANAPTVALQGAYSNAPDWVIHPTFTRYGFDSFTWTTYGAPCTSPERYLNIIPEFMFTMLITLPALMMFGIIRLALGGDFPVNIFYAIVHPLVEVFSNIVTPWAALLAIVIGMPLVWAKSKGSLQKILSSAAWIAAMMFLLTQLSDNARAFTDFTQGVVVRVSGTLACTVVNQARDDDQTLQLGAGDGEGLGADAIDDDSDIDDGQDGIDSEIEDELEDEDEGVDRDWLRGVSVDSETSAPTQCGSYLDGIYEAIWQGVPLQVWAEGQVGRQQAERDRTAERDGYIGWYQATLNSMYVNPDDALGRAQIQSTNRWNDGGYTDLNGGKPVQWNVDGRSDDTEEGGINPSNAVNNLDDDQTATIWRTIPFMLQTKFLCKDDAIGSNEVTDLWIFGDTGNYALAHESTNKWLYDGSCITGANSDIIDALMGANFVDRVGLTLAGGFLMNIVGLFTIGIAVYVLFQKFVWGFMLMFAPFILGIAAFPDKPRMQFAKKYLEFCISNIMKQVTAVLLLVITVTAMSQIVFPAAGDLPGDVGIPWLLKPLVAIAFLLAAVLFALPLKKLITGAIRGDASYVTELSKKPAKATKKTAKYGAIAGGVAATAGIGLAAGGAGAAGSSALSAAGKTASTAAMRQGGLKGSVSQLAGKQMTGMAGKMKKKQDAQASAAGITGDTSTPIGEFKRNKALNAHNKQQNSRLNTQSQQAAQKMNADAQKNGQALPYKVDKKGNLTKGARKQAKQDFAATESGQFWNSSDYSTLSGSKKDRANQVSAMEDSMRPQFTDERGNVDRKGLRSAATQEVDAMNGHADQRHRAIGQQRLNEDAQLPASERQYTDENGNVTLGGQRKLVSDIRAIDSNDTNTLNRATAQNLMAENPEHYAGHITKNNPSGDHVQAMNDANRMNYGSEGLIAGHSPTAHGVNANAAGFPIQGSQAYVPSGAPVLGTDANENVAHLEGISGSLPQNGATQEAYQNYLGAVQNNASGPEMASAHQNLLDSIQNSQGGLTAGTQEAYQNIITPGIDEGKSVSPEAAISVAQSLPSESSGVKQSLENYASIAEEHGSGSDMAIHALKDVRVAAQNEDSGAYHSIASHVPAPDYGNAGNMNMAPQAAPSTPEAPEQAAPAPAMPAASSSGPAPETPPTQSAPEQAVPQAAPQQAPEQPAPEQSAPQAAPQSAPQAPEQPAPQQSAPSAPEAQSAPAVAPQQAPEQATPQAPEQPAPQAAPPEQAPSVPSTPEAPRESTPASTPAPEQPAPQAPPVDSGTPRASEQPREAPRVDPTPAPETPPVQDSAPNVAPSEPPREAPRDDYRPAAEYRDRPSDSGSDSSWFAGAAGYAAGSASNSRNQEVAAEESRAQEIRAHEERDLERDAELNQLQEDDRPAEYQRAENEDASIRRRAKLEEQKQKAMNRKNQLEGLVQKRRQDAYQAQSGPERENADLRLQGAENKLEELNNMINEIDGEIDSTG